MKFLIFILFFYVLQLFDISTTVDPSYVISLIRKLLPVDSGRTECDQSAKERHNHNMSDNNVVQDVVARSGNGFVDTSNDLPESMDIGGNHNEERDKVSSCGEPEKLSGSSMEEAWEDHGCVLWDLAASRTHAELMVMELDFEVMPLHICFLFSLNIKMPSSSAVFKLSLNQ